MFLFGFSCIFFVYLVSWLVKSRNRPFPGPLGWPLIGSRSLRSPSYEELTILHQKYGKTFQYSVFGSEFICTMDRTLMQTIFNDRSTFPSSPHTKHALGHITGQTMFLSEGEEWERRHKVIRQFVNHQMIRKNVQTIGEYVQEMLPLIQPGTSMNLGALLHRFNFQVLGKILFDKNIQSIQNEDFSIAGVKLLDIPPVFNNGFMLRLSIPQHLGPLKLWNLPLPTWSKESTVFQGMLDLFMECINKHLETPDPEAIDLLSVLISNSNLVENGKKSSKIHVYQLNEILAECFSFFIAGETAHTVQFLVWLISGHSTVQKNIQKEIDRMVAKENKMDELDWIPEYDKILDLRYIENVIKECTRLYPIVNSIYRSPVKDIVVDGKKISKGQEVILNIFDSHRDGDFFEDPNEFKPERWENPSTSSTFTFGDGERKCIGYKFAHLQLKLVVFLLFRRFSLVVNEDHHWEVNSNVGLMPFNEDDVWVIPTRRTPE